MTEEHREQQQHTDTQNGEQAHEKLRLQRNQHPLTNLSVQIGQQMESIGSQSRLSSFVVVSIQLKKM